MGIKKLFLSQRNNPIVPKGAHLLAPIAISLKAHIAPIIFAVSEGTKKVYLSNLVSFNLVIPPFIDYIVAGGEEGLTSKGVKPLEFII